MHAFRGEPLAFAGKAASPITEDIMRHIGQIIYVAVLVFMSATAVAEPRNLQGKAVEVDGMKCVLMTQFGQVATVFCPLYGTMHAVRDAKEAATTPNPPQ